jgi:hypothetical protein
MPCDAPAGHLAPTGLKNIAVFVHPAVALVTQARTARGLRKLRPARLRVFLIWLELAMQAW